jgi:hypothetical protein
LVNWFKKRKKEYTQKQYGGLKNDLPGERKGDKLRIVSVGLPNKIDRKFSRILVLLRTAGYDATNRILSKSLLLEIAFSLVRIYYELDEQDSGSIFQQD